MKTSTPLISVILPIYKVEKYLKQCVDSVLQQTYTNIEVILVDDGSPDNCPQICDDYKKSDVRIKVVHKKNGGQSDARNCGLKEAVGDYVFFIDSDDYLIDSHVIGKIAKKVTTGCDVVLFKFQKYYEANNTMGKPSFSFPIISDYSSITAWLIELNNRDAFYNSAWSKAIKRSLLVDNNVTFENGLLGEDNDWFYQVVLHAKTFECIDEPFIVYRQRCNSITSSYKLKNLTDLIYILSKWNNIINQENSNPSIQVINASLAKQYCHALIGYQNLKDSAKKQYKKTLKKYSFLLKYSQNPRVKTFRRIYDVFGFNGIIFMLSIASLILKIKRS